MGLFGLLKATIFGGNDAAADRNVMLITQNVSYIYLHLARQYASMFRNIGDILTATGKIDLMKYISEGLISETWVEDKANEIARLQGSERESVLRFIDAILIEIFTLNASPKMTRAIIEQIYARSAVKQRAFDHQISQYEAGQRNHEIDALVEAIMTDK